MAVPLKGFLRRLRAEGAGWSYAVFWKTVQSANSRNLVWGEGDYGIPTVTGPDIPSPGLNNGTLRKSLQGGVEDQVVQRIAVMVENTMKPKVHVAGHGIVGIAGLTGNHRWVVHGTVSCDAYITQGLAEFNNQWFSGIQTVAIIPVLPHGVLQLGSTQQIMENLELVTQTRRTFAQMVCILEPSMTESFLNNSLEKGPDWAPPMGCANTNHQDRQNLDFGHLMQPSVSSISEVNWSRPSIPEPSASSIPPFTGFVNSINEFLQQKVHPNIKTIFPRFGELPNGSDGHNIISDVNTMFNRQVVAADPTSENQCNTSHSLDLPSDNPGSLQQLFSTLTSQNIRYLPGDKFVQPSFHGPTAPSYSTASTLILPSRREEPFTNENVYGKLGSLFNRSKANAPIAFKNKPSQVLASVIVDDTTTSISCHPTLSTTETHCLTETGPCVASAPLSQKHKNSGDLLQAHLVSYKDLPDHISGSYINAREIDQISGISLPAGRATQNRTCDPKGTVLDEWNVCSNDSKALASVDVVDEDVFQASVVCSSGSDLFDVLGLNQECDPYTDKVDALVKTSAMDNCKYGTNDSTYITHLDKQHNFSTSSCIPRSEALPDYRNDELLDAVVSRVNNAVRQETDEASCRTSLTRTTGSSYSNGYLNCSHPGSARNFQKETFDLSPTMLQAGIDGSTNFRPSCSINEIGECSRIEGICNSQNNLWVDNENTRNEAAPAQYKMSEDLGKSNRKRAKPGENPRPRPKDRQMIQDRVKELREIVPNGAKLSIDALLERTINHMLFLQSVTKHADKLKETREPKIISQEGGLLLKDNFEGGATWAFEVGSQSMICPIIVEDLNPPRQLLVEMLCEQRGLFLEIADLIKGLGLTILKGVMEARNDKIWARFAVEANRDVTRMDIFLSLVQLLEPRAVSSVPQQHFDGINMTNNVVGQPIAATCTVNPLM